MEITMCCASMFLGAEINEGLVQMLHKKLDDAVLDILTVTLSRNPMSKLNPEDVNVCTTRIYSTNS